MITIILLAVVFVLVVKFLPVLWDCIKTVFRWAFKLLGVAIVIAIFAIGFRLEFFNKVKVEEVETPDGLEKVYTCTDEGLNEEQKKDVAIVRQLMEDSELRHWLWDFFIHDAAPKALKAEVEAATGQPYDEIETAAKDVYSSAKKVTFPSK